jgi:hypothetical protein
VSVQRWRMAVLGDVALLAVSLPQVATAGAPVDVGVVAAALYLVGVALLGAAFVAAPVARRRPTPLPA